MPSWLAGPCLQIIKRLIEARQASIRKVHPGLSCFKEGVQGIPVECIPGNHGNTYPEPMYRSEILQTSWFHCWDILEGISHNRTKRILHGSVWKMRNIFETRDWSSEQRKRENFLWTCGKRFPSSKRERNVPGILYKYCLMYIHSLDCSTEGLLYFVHIDGKKNNSYKPPWVLIYILLVGLAPPPPPHHQFEPNDALVIPRILPPHRALLNQRHAGVFGCTRYAGGGGFCLLLILPTSDRIEAAMESFPSAF